MPIRRGLLTLLAREPMHGYQLRSEFDAATGATWPLNIGQVYTTLSRLERDGFVEAVGKAEDGRVAYRITDAGVQEVEKWFDAPVPREGRPRDELAIKLALAVTTPGVDVLTVVQTQRTATMTGLQDLTRLKARADGDDGDLAWSLVLDSLLFRAEAEIRWLDHCEARVARAAIRRPAAEARPASPAVVPAGTEGRR